MKEEVGFKSRFRILKGEKIFLVVSGLLFGALICTTNAYGLNISDDFTIKGSSRPLDLTIDSGNNPVVTVNGPLTIDNNSTALSIDPNHNSFNLNITNKSNPTISIKNNNLPSIGVDIYNNPTVAGTNILNSGAIEVNSTAGDSLGIYTTVDLNTTTIKNNGTITATAESNGSDTEVGGITTYDNGKLTDSDITNSGTITATAKNANGSDAVAGGIATDGLTDSNITNSGTITATAESNGSDSVAAGIATDGLTDSNITNSGTITATAKNANDSDTVAAGIAAYGLKNSNITNSGTITATAESNGSDAEAAGITTYDNGKLTDSNITNSGTITATAESNGSDAKTAGIAAYGLKNSNITNSGTITAKINDEFDKNGYSIYVINSDANSIITNTQTGKLYGNIHIGGKAKVYNKGLIALPYKANGKDNSAYIGGDLINTGKIQIAMLTDGNNTQYSQLRVKGNAIFNAGSVLDVNVLAASTNTKLLIGERLNDVVSADNKLTVNELKVTDNSRLLDFEYIKDNNTIDLNIVKGLTILDSTIQGSGNSDDRSAAAVLDDIQEEGIPNSMEKFYEKLNVLGTDQEVAEAVDRTVSYVAVSNIDTSITVLDNAFEVVENQGFGGLNSGDRLFRERRLWVEPFGSLGEQDDKDGIHGFDFSSRGIGIGAEGEYSDNAYIGIGFFCNRADVDVNGLDQSSDLDIYTALLYGQTPIANGNVKLRYKASVSWQDIDSNRYIALTNETAKASYTSNLYAIDLKALKDFQINDKLLLEPIIGATYKYIHTPSYTESGSSVNLSVDSSNTKRLTTYLGTKVYYQLGQRSTLNGKIKVGYDAVDDDISIVSAYSAAPNNKFTTDGIDNGRWSYSGVLGYKIQLTDQDDVNFRYEYYGEGSSYHNNMLSLRFLHRF